MTGRRSVLALLLALGACGGTQPSNADPPLALEWIIPLPRTKGRIDHLAMDVQGRRLFVAEIANDTVDWIDLNTGQVVRRIGKLSEPQGVAWLPDQHELVVACGDGSVHFYTSDGQESAQLRLGDDADNVRIDSRNGHVVVGYGDGALAILDPLHHSVLGRLTLPGHPEGFRLFGSRVYINVPDRGSVIAADIDDRRILATWPTGLHRLNFPMAIEPSGRSIVIAYRLPAALAWIDTITGRTSSIRPACGDADDLFLADGHALLVCGAGHVEVVSAEASMSVQTVRGARTGLYVPEIRSLFVAAPARGQPAAIWELKLKAPPER